MILKCLVHFLRTEQKKKQFCPYTAEIIDLTKVKIEPIGQNIKETKPNKSKKNHDSSLKMILQADKLRKGEKKTEQKYKKKQNREEYVTQKPLETFVLLRPPNPVSNQRSYWDPQRDRER